MSDVNSEVLVMEKKSSASLKTNQNGSKMYLSKIAATRSYARVSAEKKIKRESHNKKIKQMVSLK